MSALKIAIQAELAKAQAMQCYPLTPAQRLAITKAVLYRFENLTKGKMQ